MALDGFLDESIGSDLRLLPDLLRSLKRDKQSICDQLSGAETAGNHGNEWQMVVAEVRAVILKLKLIRDNCQRVLDGGEGDGVSVTLVRGEVGRCAHQISPLVTQLMEVEHTHSYLAMLVRILSLCTAIETQLKATGVANEGVELHQKLHTLSRQIERSECSNLLRFATTSVEYWGDRLRERVQSDFSAILTDMKWPFSSSSLSSQSQQIWDKNKKKFTKLFTLLIHLHPTLSTVVRSHDNLGRSHDAVGRSHDDVERSHDSKYDVGVLLLLPLEQLVQPLRKRFHYHFMGNRRTNCKEKPEWYFAQVSAWIRDHTHFLETEIQPILEAADMGHIDAVVEFTRGLLQEVTSKLTSDISELVQDDLLMAHLLDELLLFHQELLLLHFPFSSSSSSSSSHTSPLVVMLEEVPFHKWLAMEKQFAVERLSQITSSPTAWQPAYEAAWDVDDTKVPESGEGVMSLIAGITDRYRHLPSPTHQLLFLELQRDLLLEFHCDLSANGDRLAKESPILPQYCAYLNASSYIASVLKEWGEQKFFLTLHYHTQPSSSSSFPSSSTSSPPPPDIDTIIQLRKQDSEFAEVEGNIFSAVRASFLALAEKMQTSLVQHVVSVFRAGCSNYKKEKWHILTVDKDSHMRELSPSLSSLLPPLHQQLLFLRDQVAPIIFPSIFQEIANQIDNIIYSEVILSSQFGDGGAGQVTHDITKGLHPLLSQYTDELASRQLLERTREACTLLQLLPGSAKLLHELLGGVAKGRDNIPMDTYTAAIATLNDFGVHTLDPTEASKILSLKIIP